MKLSKQIRAYWKVAPPCGAAVMGSDIDWIVGGVEELERERDELREEVKELQRENKNGHRD